MIRYARSFAAFVLVWSVASPAHANDARAAASASFREAQAAFARRDFAAAAAAFEETARTMPHPATWLNAAEAWELRGDWARAAEDCDRALEVPSADAAIKREAERRLTIAASHVGTLEITGPRGFGARVDGEPVQPVPVRRRLTVGAHRVVVVELASGQETPHEVTAIAGKIQRIDVPAPAPAAPSATPPAPAPAAALEPAPPPGDEAASSAPPTASWILFATGGAFAAASGVLGVVTLNAKDTYQANPTHDTLDAFRADRLATNVTLGAAVVSLAAGAALWIWAPRKESSKIAGAR